MWLLRWWPGALLLSFILLACILGVAIRRRLAKTNAGTESSVLAPVAGKITQVLVAAGDVVRAGQEIAKVRRPGRQVAPAPTKRLPFPVTVMPLKPRRFVDAVVLPGAVEANKDVSLRAEVRGTLVDRPCEEGQRVKEGQLLVQIDPRDYEDAVEDARAAMVLAQSTYDRVQRLTKTGAATQAELDTAQAGLRQAAARKSDAERSLERTRIVSPIAGSVDRLNVEVGELIENGALVARVIDASRVKIKIGIPEADVQFVRGLKKVRFHVRAVSDEPFDGEVAYVTLAPAENARVYIMELRVDNPDGRLRPGMIVKADVVRQVVEAAVVAPLFAVMPQDHGYAVYVEERGQARRLLVKLGAFKGQEVLIVQGLELGQRLIVQGQRQIEDGQPVQAVRTVEHVEELMR